MSKKPNEIKPQSEHNTYLSDVIEGETAVEPKNVQCGGWAWTTRVRRRLRAGRPHKPAGEIVGLVRPARRWPRYGHDERRSIDGERRYGVQMPGFVGEGLLFLCVGHHRGKTGLAESFFTKGAMCMR